MSEREALRAAVVAGTEAYAEAMIPGTYVSEYIADAILAAGFRQHKPEESCDAWCSCGQPWPHTHSKVSEDER